MDDFQQELDGVKLMLAQQFGNEQVAQMPDRLFHYTTAEGMLGILSSKEFWATHMSYLNDSSELSYGSTLVAERLANLSKLYDALPQWKAFLDLAHSNRNAFDNILEAYAICFCTNGDLLSQWRGYGLSGGGYSISLRPSAFNEPVETEEAISKESIPLLRKVIYDPLEQQELIDLAIIEVSGVVTRYWHKQKDERARQRLIDACVSALRDFLVNYLVCLKNPVFKEEAEWRYVLVRPRGSRKGPPRKFRARAGALIPYIEVDVFGHPHGQVHVSDIYCGPVLNPQLSVFAIEDMLGSLGYEGVKVHRSSIPLRG